MGIQVHIGQRPLFAAGNSDGDIHGWLVISMQRDWHRIFPFEQK